MGIQLFFLIFIHSIMFQCPHLVVIYCYVYLTYIKLLLLLSLLLCTVYNLFVRTSFCELRKKPACMEHYKDWFFLVSKRQNTREWCKHIFCWFYKYFTGMYFIFNWMNNEQNRIRIVKKIALFTCLLHFGHFRDELNHSPGASPRQQAKQAFDMKMTFLL